MEPEHDAAAERALTDALRRLPDFRAPDPLRRAVAARWNAPPAQAVIQRPVFGKASVAVLALVAGIALTLGSVAIWRARSASDAMVAEAVNDHLRVLYGDRPLEVQSGGIHQVKPWFEGRLDFAPAVAFGGDEDFPLQGGAVAYFVDRKAATFVFKHRLHVMTLFVFRAEGLGWPVVETERIGTARGSFATSRGFHVLLWRTGDLGYALVSDVDPQEVRTLAARIEPP